jgi:hypothetical protein
MINQLDTLTIPRSGKLQLDIHLSVQVNVTATVARRKVNAFLALHVGNLLLADEPALTLAEQIVWRVPVDLTSPLRGRIGRIAEIDVDVESGELLLDKDQIETIEENARRIVASAAL